MAAGFISPYEDTDYLKKRWGYSDLEVLYQDLNNLVRVSNRTYIKGLNFKTIGSHLTSSGLGSGSAGWYLECRCEGEEIILADRHPEVVLEKALYWLGEGFKGNPLPNESFMRDFRP
jgi:hypothetical protein